MLARPSPVRPQSAPEIRIRIARDADEPRIRAFLKRQRVALSHLSLCPTIDLDLTAIEAHYNNRDGFILLAEDETGEIVGSLAAFPSSEDVWEIRKCYADGAVRGQALIEKLFAIVLRRARELGISAILIETHASLTSAIRLYQRLGFSRCREHRCVIVTDGIWLIRKLKR